MTYQYPPPLLQTFPSCHKQLAMDRSLREDSGYACASAPCPPPCSHAWVGHWPQPTFNWTCPTTSNISPILHPSATRLPISGDTQSQYQMSLGENGIGNASLTRSFLQPAYTASPSICHPSTVVESDAQSRSQVSFSASDIVTLPPREAYPQPAYRTASSTGAMKRPSDPTGGSIAGTEHATFGCSSSQRADPDETIIVLQNQAAHSQSQIHALLATIAALRGEVDQLRQERDALNHLHPVTQDSLGVPEYTKFLLDEVTKMVHQSCTDRATHDRVLCTDDDYTDCSPSYPESGSSFKIETVER